MLAIEHKPEVDSLFHLTCDADTIILKVNAGRCLWPPVDLKSQMLRDASWDPEAASKNYYGFLCSSTAKYMKNRLIRVLKFL